MFMKADRMIPLYFSFLCLMGLGNTVQRREAREIVCVEH
jgi:hypothetical protein